MNISGPDNLGAPIITCTMIQASSPHIQPPRPAHRQSATLPQQFQQSAAASICCPPTTLLLLKATCALPALITACQTPAQEDFSAIYTLYCAAHLSTPIKEYFKDSKAQLVTYMNFSAFITPPAQVLHARQGTLSHYQKSYLDFGY